MAQTVHNLYLGLLQQVKRLSNMYVKPAEPFQVHGKIMLLVWGVIAPLSIFFGKFGRNFMPRKMAMVLHIMCNLGMISCGGFAIYLSVSSCTYHFVSLHQKLGLTIALLSIIQGTLGVLLVIYKGRVPSIRKVHGLLGVSIWLAAMNNAFLGSEMLGWNIGIYLAAFLFLMISIFIGLSWCSSSWFERAGARERVIAKGKEKKTKTIQTQGSPSDQIAKRTSPRIVK